MSDIDFQNGFLCGLATKGLIKTGVQKGMKPQAAVAKFCIDLTDPVTGKVLERMNGTSHVFEDVLYAGGGSTSWIDATSQAWMVLNDSQLPIDPDMPYVMGQTVGYGRPSQSGKGLFRGAYNAANQKLAEWDLTSIRWKFQYDFTPPQAVGTIRQIGLTHQYNRSLVRYQQSRIPISQYTYAVYHTSDERYSYSCSRSGIVSKYDNYLGTFSEINISSLVGTLNSPCVAYAPATGKYYIYDLLLPNKPVYEFADNTFTSLNKTYELTRAYYLTGDYSTQAYVHDGCLYIVAIRAIIKIDFVNDTAPVEVLITSDVYNNAAVSESSYANNFYPDGAMGVDSYIMCFSAATNRYKGLIFDMATDSVVGYMSAATNTAHCVHPFTTSRIFCGSNGAMSAAITAKKLDADFVKPADKGMTATYELEVFW